MKPYNKDLYERITPRFLKFNFFRLLLNFKNISKRLWEIENIIEISILRGDNIEFNRNNNNQIISYQKDGEEYLHKAIDPEYIKKIKEDGGINV